MVIYTQDRNIQRSNYIMPISLEKKKSSKEKAKSETLPPFSEGRYPKDGRDIFGPWTKVEEQALRQGVEKYGVGHWNEIIKRGAFAKDKTKPGIAHYYYHVISREKTPPWTKEEDQRLIKLVAEKRGKWKEFADILRRPLPEVYNRFNNFLIPGGKFGKWTDEENRELLVAVRKYGENWEKVKECLPSRTLLAIKEHYQDSPLFKLHRNYHKWKMLTPDHLDKRRNRIFEIIPR
ncbi:hypothetical protein G9A89_011997 [Geosiphon pyriformis]|nr:hypothetical protein G9A89_011997 [Geosiphon pyriformis]